MGERYSDVDVSKHIVVLSASRQHSKVIVIAWKTEVQRTKKNAGGKSRGKARRGALRPRILRESFDDAIP
jgi:hypothetical protein